MWSHLAPLTWWEVARQGKDTVRIRMLSIPISTLSCFLPKRTHLPLKWCQTVYISYKNITLLSQQFCFYCSNFFSQMIWPKAQGWFPLGASVQVSYYNADRAFWRARSESAGLGEPQGTVWSSFTGTARRLAFLWTAHTWALCHLRPPIWVAEQTLHLGRDNGLREPWNTAPLGTSQQPTKVKWFLPVNYRNHYIRGKEKYMPVKLLAHTVKSYRINFAYASTYCLIPKSSCFVHRNQQARRLQCWMYKAMNLFHEHI